MENQDQESNEENPFEGFRKNAETSKEMPDEEAYELLRQAERDAIASEQHQRTGDQSR